MTIHKAEISASKVDAEALALLFSEMLDPPPAVSTRENGEDWLVELYVDELPDPVALEAIGDAYGDADAFRNLVFKAVPDENWVEITQRGLHPVIAGRFFVHGSHDRPLAAAHSYAIEIDAGQAFGTAHHGTTRGCLTMIDRLAKSGRYRRVLDLGTGSGILAIAAAKSLSRHVIAADIDPVAVRVAAENAALSGVAPRIDAVCASRPGDRLITGHAPYQLIVANILAGPLIALAAGLRRIIANGGQLILSGLLDEQAQMVSACYIAHGFVMRGRLSIDGWSTLHMQAARSHKKKPPERSQAV